MSFYLLDNIFTIIGATALSLGRMVSDSNADAHDYFFRFFSDLVGFH
jgi:hypothetical protein